MSSEKQPASLGFGDELDQLSPEDWTKTDTANDKLDVDTELVRQVAEKEGFSSREPIATLPPVAKAAKAPTDQINFRAKVTVIEDFRALSKSQEPDWPLGYTLERALAALQRELDEQ